jgi:hypothetical protein
MPTVRSALLIILVSMATLGLPALSPAAVFLSVTVSPPLLPVYAQPVCPGDGYIWVPGYWAYAPGGYYWVPGAWVLAPFVGALWTPGYWAWRGDAYFWNAGYWGLGVGFYGGINYGFGYFGSGYVGGYWHNRAFHYNRAVNNVNIANVHNVYNRTAFNSTAVSRVSYHGGAGGTTASPTRTELAVARGRHTPSTAAQTRLLETARRTQGRDNSRVQATTSRRAADSRATNPASNAAHRSRSHSQVAGSTRPIHPNTRSVATPGPRDTAKVQQTHSTARSAPTSRRSASQPQYHSRSVAAPRASAPRADSTARFRSPVSASRAAPPHAQVSTPPRNQSQGAPRSRSALPTTRGGEKRKG